MNEEERKHPEWTSCIVNYYEDWAQIETDNAINDANLEVPRAMIEVWQAVVLHLAAYPLKQVERLEDWIRDEVDFAWKAQVDLVFDRELGSVQITNGPVGIFIEDLKRKTGGESWK